MHLHIAMFDELSWRREMPDSMDESAERHETKGLHEPPALNRETFCLPVVGMLTKLPQLHSCFGSENNGYFAALSTKFAGHPAITRNFEMCRLLWLDWRATTRRRGPLR